MLLSASITFPVVPTLPSSVATYDLHTDSSSSCKNVSLSLYPITDTVLIPFFLSASAHPTMGGIPIPPPRRITLDIGSIVSTGNPFPRGPIRLILSPFLYVENSFVPFPAILYTSLIVISLLLIWQMLIGRGSILSLSLQYIETNCPAFALKAISVSIRREYTSLAISSCNITFPIVLVIPILILINYYYHNYISNCLSKLSFAQCFARQFLCSCYIIIIYCYI